jgi:hypothetical protein
MKSSRMRSCSEVSCGIVFGHVVPVEVGIVAVTG